MKMDSLDEMSANMLADSPIKLFETAREIRLWQEGQSPRLSDNALLQKFPALGSTKTFKKLRESDADQLRVEDWLPAYEGVLEQIRTQSAEEVEAIYQDLSFAQEIYRETLQLVRSTGLNRLIIVEGGSGYGKTESLNLIKKQLPGGVIYADADESWARPAVMVGQLCLAAGAVRKREDLPGSLAARLALLVNHLQAKRVVLIDEGHHLSGPSINLLKTLISRTPSVFVIAALDTLWKKLQTNAWQEAKQLIFNRMFARIRLSGPTNDDATKYLGRRLKLEGDGIAKAIRTLVDVATVHGGMAFLRNVVHRVNRLGAGEHADAATLLEAGQYVKRQVEGK